MYSELQSHQELKKNYNGWQPNYIKWEIDQVEHVWKKTPFNKWIDIEAPQIEFVAVQRAVLRNNLGTIVHQVNNESFKVFIPDIGSKDKFLWAKQGESKWFVKGSIVSAEVEEKKDLSISEKMFSYQMFITKPKFQSPLITEKVEKPLDRDEINEKIFAYQTAKLRPQRKMCNS